MRTVPRSNSVRTLLSHQQPVDFDFGCHFVDADWDPLWASARWMFVTAHFAFCHLRDLEEAIQRRMVEH